MAIDRFSGNYAFLSNFYPSEVKFEGIVYPTVEHAFQAAKTNDPAERAYVLAAPTPATAKYRGRKVHLRTDWEGIKIGIMLYLLTQKFTLETELASMLVATGDEELIEGNNWHDQFWGVANGKGENWLGQLLMTVRVMLKEDRWHK